MTNRRCKKDWQATWKFTTGGTYVKAFDYTGDTRIPFADKLAKKYRALPLAKLGRRLVQSQRHVRRLTSRIAKITAFTTLRIQAEAMVRTELLKAELVRQELQRRPIPEIV